MFERFKRKKAKPRQPKSAFKADVAEIQSFKKMLKSQQCPGCGQNTFALRSFGRGPEGFQADVRCTNCRVLGTVNVDGFHFINMSKLTAKQVPIRTG